MAMRGRLMTALALLGACAAGAAEAAPDPRAVLATYADIAQAMYADSLTRAKELETAVEALTRQPGAETLAAARRAWLAAREPYQQSEAYRFGNAIVDDWEGKVNAWPLDEGLIDYVDAGSYGAESDENPLYTANVVAAREIEIAGEKVDVSRITKELLEEKLQEAGGVEANVAIGYHAVEFLLWGQDLNGTGPGAGERPWTDYAFGAACTGGNCDRRAAYLKTAASLLVDHLEWMAAQWGPQGEARAAVMTEDPREGLTMMLTGLGSLSYGELAGERMKLGLLLHDPEEEHDCFSDNTHNSHYYDVMGIRAVYRGEYVRIDGSTVKGPSLSELVAARNPRLDREMLQRLSDTHAKMWAIKERAETKERYDQMIGPDNVEGNAAVQAAIDALTRQTRAIERIVSALRLQAIQIEGSDSLDNPSAVFK